jgi:NADPH:quinone reductase-like Zn-dependent oxidoreductase
MKAVTIENKAWVVTDTRPRPQLREDYVLVKPVAVALNPADWKHAAFGIANDGDLMGCDFSGIVEEIGPAVTKSFQKGDEVMGVAHGSNAEQPEDGAFAEYIVAKGDTLMKKPANLSFEKAATLSLGAITCGQGLFQKALKLQMPDDPVKSKTYVLIYGGSTATGALGIQFATLYATFVRGLIVV